MPITPRLSRQLQEALGEEAAEDLVTWMQTVDAQRGEFRDLNALQQARVDARFAETREAVRAEIADLRQELHTGFAGMESRFAALETRFERRFGDLIKWSFVFWVGAVSAVALLANVIP